MGFVNRYLKTDNFNYHYSEEFVENETPFIYSVGQTKVPIIDPNTAASLEEPDYEQVGLISKVNLKGDIVWEKTYTVNGEINPTIKNIIQLRDSSGQLDPFAKYVVHVQVESGKNFLLSINLDGSVRWTKHIEWGIGFELNFFIKESKIDNTFYIAVSSTYFGMYGYNTYVAKYKENGGLIIDFGGISDNHNSISYVGIYITGIDTFNEGLVLISHHRKGDSENVHINKFNTNLVSIQGVRYNNSSFENPLNEENKIEFQDIKITNNTVIVSGKLFSGKINGEELVDERYAIILKFNLQTLAFIESIIFYPSDGLTDTKLAIIGTDIYCVWNDKNNKNTTINLFNESLAFIWSKQIFINDDINYIKRISSKNNRLTFTCNDATRSSHIINSNRNLQTCKTAVLEPILYKMFVAVFYYGSGYFSPNPLNIDTTGPVITATLCNLTSYIDKLCPNDNAINIDIEKTLFQSPNFVLAAAGSNANDGSATGIHLRWTFAQALGDNHLPKGNYYSGINFLFNKPDDFVRIYRAKYLAVNEQLDFSNPPDIVNNNQCFWVYYLQGKPVYIKFKNAVKYNQVLGQYQPLVQPLNFIEKYGNELIEIECKRDLFFACSVFLKNLNTTPEIRIESLSVEKNFETAPKITSSRKTFNALEINNGIKILCDNGRSIRLKATNCALTGISFEFYSSFIEYTNRLNAWDLLNDFALSTIDDEVLTRLEPISNIVNNNWPRFNDNEKVKIENYINKWKRPTTLDDKNIKQIIEEYLIKSSDINNENPRGLLTIDYGSGAGFEIPDPNPEEDGLISLLDVLNIGAHDYHIARMLGLGTLDLSADVTNGESYIYVAEYITFENLDGNGEKEIQHLSMSLPTSILDFRLPIPYNIKEIVKGIIVDPNEINNGSTTDSEGYTQDGKSRIVTLITENLPEDEVNKLFYWSNKEFNRSEFTYPLYAGVEYKKNQELNWIKPELINNVNYQNTSSNNETIPLLINNDSNILTVHKQRESGIHYYSSYGINIFSRATISTVIKEITTVILPNNNLKPPLGVNPLLIRKEVPLMLTSESEQSRKNLIADGQDDTLIRLTFDYNAIQELSRYLVEDIYLSVNDSILEQEIVNGLPTQIYPDDKEIFANEVEIFFRNQLPNAISGKVNLNSIITHPTNSLLVIFETEPYILASTSTSGSAPSLVIPSICVEKINNYIGGIFLIDNQSFIIHEIDVSNTYPIFTVFKTDVSTSILTNQQNSGTTILQVPLITNDGLFSVVENLQNTITWNNPTGLNPLSNPHNLKVLVGFQNSIDWKIKREVINNYGDDNQLQRFIEKSRGIWKNGVVEVINEPINQVIAPDGTISYTSAHNGLYKITFSNYSLPQHSQFNSNSISVEWFKGVVRLRTASSLLIKGERKSFEVIKHLNNASNQLEIYFRDVNFIMNSNNYDPVAIGNQLVSFYPSYRVYLYKKDNLNMNNTGILPILHQGEKLSVFGLRSHNIANNYFSKFSVPAIMFAQELAEPQQPQLPLGSNYATKPDYFGKSTYSFTNKFGNPENSNYSPHGLLFLRTNEDIILDSLYSKSTHNFIVASLAKLGGNDELFLQNRWNNFFDFGTLKATGIYEVFPKTGNDKFAFPIPNSIYFISAINDFINWHNQTTGENIANIQSILSLNQVIISSVTPPILAIDFIEETTKNTFQPLTEMPIIFQYIKFSEPTPKKQTIKDRDGYLLKTDHQDFDMAPMAKRISNSNNHVLFTDFTLDGTSKNIYFYSVREMSNQMQMGSFSPFLGPIKLINSNPPSAPEIKRIMPVFENKALGILPSIQFEINSYDKIHQIKKINLYRTFNRQNADSVRLMELIKVIDIEDDDFENDPIWKFIDDFSKLTKVPYSDPIFYRITVSKKVESPNGNSVAIDYIPSTPSKITATTIVENYSPESPVVKYASQPINSSGKLKYVTLFWNENVYKGNYYLYKMNAQGNWVEVARIYADRLIKGNYHIFNTNGVSLDWNEATTLNALDGKIYLPLEFTNLNASSLETKTPDGNTIYHHFKVIAENTSGMFSNKENILSIYNLISWNDIGGIATPDHLQGMIIGPTFIINPDGLDRLEIGNTLEIE